MYSFSIHIGAARFIKGLVKSNKNGDTSYF